MASGDLQAGVIAYPFSKEKKQLGRKTTIPFARQEEITILKESRQMRQTAL